MEGDGIKREEGGMICPASGFRLRILIIIHPLVKVIMADKLSTWLYFVKLTLLQYIDILTKIKAFLIIVEKRV